MSKYDFSPENNQLKMFEDQMKQQREINDTNVASSMFSSSEKQNLIEWELDFKSDLTNIEHLLRCDILHIDNDGNEIWKQNPDQSKVFMNDLGVNDIIRKIILLVNKNKVLSNYSIDEIRPRVRMIEHELRALIYNNYEDYGMDNAYKQNNYSMIVLTIGSIIEDTFRRALSGSAHKDLSETRLVTQNEPLGQGNYQNRNVVGNGSKRLVMPWNWGRRG